MGYRVLLADDHAIFCDGLRLLIEQQPGMEVVGIAMQGREAVRLARELRPDLVIIDVAMPDLNGIEAARQILAERPDLKIIALSMHSDRRYVTGMLQAGVAGYLVKDSAFEELALAIGAVMAGKSYLSPSIAGVVVDAIARRVDAPSPVPIGRRPLSAREREILQLLAEGHAPKVIAARLHVSVKTVETHRRNVMRKIGVDSIAELTKYAIREGMTSLER